VVFLSSTASTLEVDGNKTYHRTVLFERLFGRFRRKHKTVEPLRSLSDIPEDESLDPNNPFPDVVTIEFQDVLDLHAIPPAQIRAVVEDYLEEAHRRGVRWVRIIHGKGIGVQRERIRSILSRTHWVVDFRDAPAESGGWGATIVTLEINDSG
jgi:Smr domain-containing protein